MWGQDTIKINGNIWGGIIPTRVGTRITGKFAVSVTEDHPHACGDKNINCGGTELHLGSSPRVWGQVRNSVLIFTISRIIPTRVGTRITGKFAVSVTEDHPHACGDKNINCGGTELHLGSSPRVWGQVRNSVLIFTISRIIPTRVGTSKYERQLLSNAEDHPHACGDKHTCQSSEEKIRGSSPRVWGQEHLCQCRKRRMGIIPTRVGTSGL